MKSCFYVFEGTNKNKTLLEEIQWDSKFQDLSFKYAKIERK